MSEQPNATSARPLVTIVTPVYNASAYIDKCVRSVLEQDYPYWEQVIVDDGSSDDTGARIAAYNDHRIRHIKLPHRGLGALGETYNTALQASPGSLVAILEGDDFWPSDKLSRQVPAFDSPGTVITWGKSFVVDKDDRPVKLWKQSRHARRVMTFDELFRRLARSNVLTPAVTVMVRRAALDAIGGFQQRAGAPYVDLPTWLVLAANTSGTARYIDHMLGYYRVHAQQTTIQKDYEMRFSHYEVLQSVLNELSPQERAKLGWDRKAERGALINAHQTRGVALLRKGEPARAARHFASAVAERLRP